MNRIKLTSMKLDRRKLFVAGATILLAGCKVIPGGPVATTTGPVATPTPEPSATALPTDETRHRIALLVPLSGDNGAVGNSIANATTMAILDTNASNLRITTYDTAGGARSAARKAIAEGNKLILGPLMANNVPNVLAEARPANVPLISFSNDTSVAGPDVFVMGHIPSQSILRTVEYARQNGSTSFGVIAPEGEYGDQASAAVKDAVREFGGSLVATETYARGNTSIISAAQRLKQRGGFDTVLIADGARLAALAAGELNPRGAGTAKILGTELLSGEAGVTRTSALRSTLFSAVSDSRFKRFSDSYNSRFGGQPYRISTLGYDGVLLTLRVARDWRVGSTFPIAELRSDEGFLGLDGAFRFRRNGVIERAMEVREIQDGKVVIVSPAPATF
ncbi:penicillin-binding protein activator [Pontixanthobacter gangjinensis]|uniref:ABC transporter substrate-binding protein n=1 Tax=Pontixanthobacter gangjinensis TaxID=1028742 RepID=A0A6I4SMU7_9SPHN|nr:penicillin-binding protein activator [Pontixanthobacter gangjinensis]MXO57019.1 ABC transporter substrate-binding protein [Pontixanthobacter gangjinensis]